jgi:cob(I)alamin adenosyltransferase
MTVRERSWSVKDCVRFRTTGSLEGMSIATKTGDKGTTGLMYNRRVAKDHPRVEAYGSVDELNTALGFARSCSPHAFINENLLVIQRDLVVLMGELATTIEDLPRYLKDGFSQVSPDFTKKLDQWIAEIEKQNITYKGWATPGHDQASAALEMARTTCRRAERRVCALLQNDQLGNPEVVVYLNRLADLLWLMARWIEVNTP